MNSIFLNISMVAIAAAIFKMIIPDSTFKKQIAFLISCFFISSIMFFVTDGGIDLTGVKDALENKTEYVDFSEKITAATKKEVAKEMSDKVKEILSKNNITADKIYIIVNIKGMYSISINEIQLVFENTDSETAEKAKELVSKEVGKEILVSIISDVEEESEGNS